MKTKPIIGITMGDPASIGPEIAIKALQSEEIYDICRPIVIGDYNVIKNACHMLNLSFSVNRINHINQSEYNYGKIDVYDLNNVDLSKLKQGEISIEAGKAAFESVAKVIELAQAGSIDATVTGPINKESINRAGYHYSGHTEIYAHLTNTKKYGMLLVENNFRVIHVSTHVSLRDACDLVKKERILDTIELLHNACQQLGLQNPKIAVAGLNPHSSDGGLFGNEEKLEIIPAVEEGKKRGYLVEGPIPADSLFPKAIGGVYDGIVAMYHDQGHIPFKLVGFSWDNNLHKMKSVSGVNITLGLPIIRTSVDHGTAMEIAGKGIASPDAMILAIKYAVKLSNSRKIQE
ncbi:MAG: 4-hydroxythreonine-4-phosphate dehydrogenase PdxA [Ignavibacteriae bacterium]|nr:4-hydroxythreonine-4-phosphate dehydrogenase PdxA [Ignavibacteriota bacterium]